MNTTDSDAGPPVCPKCGMFPNSMQHTPNVCRINELHATVARQAAEIAELKKPSVPTGHNCSQCKGTIWSNESEIIDREFKHFHIVCAVTARAEKAEAEIERLNKNIRWCVELGHSLGWNGVENSKILHVFLGQEIERLTRELEWQKASGLSLADKVFRFDDEVRRLNRELAESKSTDCPTEEASCIESRNGFCVVHPPCEMTSKCIKEQFQQLETELAACRETIRRWLEAFCWARKVSREMVNGPAVSAEEMRVWMRAHAGEDLTRDTEVEQWESQQSDCQESPSGPCRGCGGPHWWPDCPNSNPNKQSAERGSDAT